MSRRESIAALREAARAEAAGLLRMIAGPRNFEDTIQACIARAASRLGWSYGRTEDIWRREARRIESFEMDALRTVRRRNIDGAPMADVPAFSEAGSTITESGGKPRKRKRN